MGSIDFMFQIAQDVSRISYAGYRLCDITLSLSNGSAQNLFNIKAGFCVPCVSGNCLAQHGQTDVWHIKHLVFQFPPV